MVSRGAAEAAGRRTVRDKAVKKQDKDEREGSGEERRPVRLDDLEREDEIAREAAAPKKRKWSLYNLFNPDKDGKGVEKDEDVDRPRNLRFYFTLLRRNFGRMFSLNLLFVIGNFPIIFIFLALAGFFSEHATSPQSVLFPGLYGAMQAGDPNPVIAALFGIHGVQASVRIFSTTDYVLLGIGAIGLLFTFGLVNCGVAILFRNIVKGEPLFIWQDFIGTIKRNFRQGLLLGIFDLVFLAVIVFDVIYFYANLSGYFSSVLFWAAIFIGIFYLMMRMYMYLLLVTFDLSIFKILKNSLIFSLLGIKRNLMALLGCAAYLLLNYLLLTIYFPLGFIAPFILTIGLLLYTTTYAAWPKIKQIMVDPYYDENGNPKEKEEAEQ